MSSLKDEIKEILDNPKILILSYGNYISLDDYFKLKDCITNLQEENERLKENAEHNDKVVDKAKWNEMIYKSRNEKAIPMLKELNIKLKEILKIGIDIKEISDIENILNGGDE